MNAYASDNGKQCFKADAVKTRPSRLLCGLFLGRAVPVRLVPEGQAV